MIKRFLVLLFFFVIHSGYVFSMNETIYSYQGIQYKKNSFGDIFPLWQNIPHGDLLSKLSQLVAYLGTIKGTPCILEVPHEKAVVLDIIKKAGFELYYADNEKTEWIIKNGSPIPAPYTTTVGAVILVQKGNTVLVVEEKTRPGCLEFPAGTVDQHELVRETAARELQEEVNLHVAPNMLQLCAIRNRVRENRFNVNGLNYYFTVDATLVSGELKPDGKEILRAFYTPLQDIIDKKSIQGLAVIPSIAAIAQHLHSGRQHSFSQDFIDLRQLPKPESYRNHTDIMTIEFIAQ